MAKCFVCDDSCTVDDSVECQNCFKVFHGNKCLNLPVDLAKIVNSIKNVKFFCDDCIKLNVLSKTSDKSNVPLENKKLSDLFTVIDSLSADVKTIKSTIDNTLGDASSPRRKRSSSISNNTTATYSDVASVPFNFNANQSTFIQPSFSGVIRGSASAVTEGPTVKILEPLSWYHVSQFDPSVEIADMIPWLTNITRINDIKCVKLIPKNRSINELTFVSFKFGIRQSDAQLIMDPSIWPMHIIVKPFLERPPVTRQMNFRPPPGPVITD